MRQINLVEGKVVAPVSYTHLDVYKRQTLVLLISKQYTILLPVAWVIILGGSKMCIRDSIKVV